MIETPVPKDAIGLGATLYLPATRADLVAIACDRRYPELRSAVICLEDSIRADVAPQALANVARLLPSLPEAQDARVRLFIRPRDPAMLARLLALPGIERVEGFVIPKATADSLPCYLAMLAADTHRLMPTLESREMYDPVEIRRLRDQLLAIQERVLAVRIGGNDLLQAIGARRSAVRTAYDGPLGATIIGLVAAFAPYGFALSAPVLEHYTRHALLREEVERDIEHGLLTKTAIHPAQIATIQGVYAVAADDLAEARAILSSESPAVFGVRGSMCEQATHASWARAIVRRAECFGIRRDPLSVVV